jgi:hypothetical protein
MLFISIAIQDTGMQAAYRGEGDVLTCRVMPLSSLRHHFQRLLAREYIDALLATAGRGGLLGACCQRQGRLQR